MRSTLSTAAAGGMIAAGLAAAAPAAALDPGPVELLLNDCTPKQTNTLDPACSHLGLKPDSTAGKYVYLNADWRNGTYDDTNGALSFPAASQKWPTTTGYLGVRVKVQPTGDVTGTLDPSGKLDLTMPYEVDIAGPGIDCRLNGTANLTTDGTDPFNAQPGSAFDTATGAFALVTTPASPITFQDPAACTTVKGILDPDIETNGITFYLTGTLFDQTGEIVAPPDKQTASYTAAKRVKPKGKTTLLRRPVFTDIGQGTTIKVTWRPTGGKFGTKKKYATVRITKQGEVILRTKGKTRKLFVKMRVTAPAVEGYTAYKSTKRWTTTLKTKPKKKAKNL